MTEVATIGRVFRQESGRSVAALIRLFGDVDIAEDAVQDAFTTALRLWPSDGLPPNPGGWITTTARRCAIDRRIPYRVPEHDELPERLHTVLAVLYLIYNAGAHRAGNELRAEAIRPARLLTALLPDEPKTTGLLALLLLTESRFGADGTLVLLRDQDRTRWDRELIAEGHTLVRACLRRDRPGPYQLQAAINAVHTDATSMESTDWTQILTLYDQCCSRSARRPWSR